MFTITFSPPEKIEEGLKHIRIVLFQNQKKSLWMKKSSFWGNRTKYEQPDEIIYMIIKGCLTPWYSNQYWVIKNCKNINQTNETIPQESLCRKNYIMYVENCQTNCSIINNSKLKELKPIQKIKTKTSFNKGYKKEMFQAWGGRILKAWKLPPKEQYNIGAEIAATMLCEGKSSLIVKFKRGETYYWINRYRFTNSEEGGLILLDVSAHRQSRNCRKWNKYHSNRIIKIYSNKDLNVQS